MKKILALMAALTMLIAVATGCNSDEKSSSTSTTKSSTTDKQSVDSDEDDEDAEDEDDGESVDADTAEYAEALAGTLWLGMDTEYNCFALGFGEEEIALEANDGSSVSGYWGVTAGDPTIYIFEDAELTTEVASMPWSYDTENDIMILNDSVIMAQTDAYSMEDAAAALEQMATASQVQEYLQGTYWVGFDEDSASAVSMNGSEFELIEVNADGSMDEGSYLWSMDYDSIYLYDESNTLVSSFSWDMAADGSMLELTSASGEVLEMEQVSEEDATDIIAYLYVCLNLEYTGE